ncbi:MAG TPA: hypothetical protein VFA32_13405, partial [Dehalococcoidia bacterium]|nr:hypothetical protein [Dehalococcoidia bacterium]
AKPSQTQMLQIFRLKAKAPEKYREEVKVINADVPFQMLDRLKEMAREEREWQAALEAPAVEAVYRGGPPVQSTQPGLLLLTHQIRLHHHRGVGRRPPVPLRGLPGIPIMEPLLVR